MEEYLQRMLESLNSLEVKGKDNLNVLLGSIIATEKQLEELEESVVKEDG